MSGQDRQSVSLQGFRVAGANVHLLAHSSCVHTNTPTSAKETMCLFGSRLKSELKMTFFSTGITCIFLTKAVSQRSFIQQPMSLMNFCG